jgi:hypothetical protein
VLIAANVRLYPEERGSFGGARPCGSIDTLRSAQPKI